MSGGVKTVVFSADAADEALYAKLRVNGNLKNVLKNIEKFNKIKTTRYPNKKIITRVSGVKVNDSQDINAMQNIWGNLVNQVAFVDYNPGKMFIIVMKVKLVSHVQIYGEGCLFGGMAKLTRVIQIINQYYHQEILKMNIKKFGIPTL